MIQVTDLVRTFTLRKRLPGLLGSIRSLVSAETEVIRAVDGVAFTIERGELVGYLGPNGAGKSTTIKMLTGILQPSSGTVSVDGIDPSRDRVRLARRIGVVFGQKTQLWWDLPVGESFDLLRTIYRIPRPDFARRMQLFGDLLRIGDFLAQQTRKLSLGQRMRAVFAASLLHNPSVLFLDEPTIGLDILSRDAVRTFIKELNREERTTVILTTHDMQDIELLATRLILLDRGRIQYDGQIEAFNRRYAGDRIVAVHLEDGGSVGLLHDTRFEVVRSISPQHFEVRLGPGESVGPLIQTLTERGGRIEEVNVRKQDLADTLKLLYTGRNLEL